MYQPLASDIVKKPFPHTLKKYWFDFKVRWWMWSGQNEKSLQYWRDRFKYDQPNRKLKTAQLLVFYQVYDEVLEFLLSIPEEKRNTEMTILLGKCYLGKGEISEALKEIQKALNNSLNSNLLELHSDCLLEQGKWEEAIKSLEKALRISPNRVETIYRLGTIYLYHGEYLEALRCFQGCCNLSTRNPLFWEMKAETHLELEQFLDAVQSYKQALKYGVNQNLHARLAYCYIQLNDTKKGIKHYKKVLNNEPDHYDSLCNLAAVYQNLGQSLEALKLLERAYDINANDPILLNNLAYTLVHLGRSRKAVEIYKKSLEISPQNRVILYNLSVCYANKGNWEEAIATINILLGIEKDHTDGWILLGNIYEQIAKFDDAVDCFNNALKLA